MLAAILWVFAGVLALIVLALSLPLRLRLVAESAPARRVRLLARPLGGLAPALRLVDSARPKKERPAKKKAKEKKPKPRRRRRDGWGDRGIRMARAAPGFVGGLLRQFRILRIEAEADFGFDDPADTGAVYGLLAPFAFGLPPGTRSSVVLRPDFETPRLSGRIDATVEVTPIRLLPPALRFAWRSFGPAAAAQ